MRKGGAEVPLWGATGPAAGAAGPAGGGEHMLAPSMLSKERGSAGVHRSAALRSPPSRLWGPPLGRDGAGIADGSGTLGAAAGGGGWGPCWQPPHSIALLGGAAGPRSEAGVGYQRRCTAARSPRGAEQEFSRELASSRAGTAGPGAGGCVALQPRPPLRECQVLGWSSGGCVFTGGHKAGPRRSWAHRDARMCARVSSDGAHFPCAWSVIKNVLIAKCN